MIYSFTSQICAERLCVGLWFRCWGTEVNKTQVAPAHGGFYSIRGQCANKCAHTQVTCHMKESGVE